MIIYLYIKQHSVTGLKYFGRTESDNPFKYPGSGIRWTRHYKKHGKRHIKTLEIWGFDNQELCTEFALKFSADNDIVQSKDWANLIPENGLRISANLKTQKEVNQSISDTLKRKYKSGEISASNRNKGKSISDETKAKISQTWKRKTSDPNYIHHTTGIAPWNKGLTGSVPWNKGLTLPPQTEDSNRKRSTTLKELYKTKPGNRKNCAPWNKGITGSIPWNKGFKMPTIKCPHCHKEGDNANMKRWHFDNCKLRS